MIRKGWAPPRKRPKRIEKKMRRNQRRHWGWRPNYPIVMSRAAMAEFLRQLENPPSLSPALVAAMRDAMRDRSTCDSN